MPETMRAIRKPGRAPGLILDEVPVPHPGEDEVLVQVEAASVCGTDLHIHRWDEWSQQRIQPPLTLGHEFAGTVVEGRRRPRPRAPALRRPARDRFFPLGRHTGGSRQP